MQGKGKRWTSGPREEWSRGDLILTELGSEGEGEGQPVASCHGPELDPSLPILAPVHPLSSRLLPPSSTSSPSPASRAAVHYGARGPFPHVWVTTFAQARRPPPTAHRPPSQHLPHSRGKGAHKGTSPRPLPAGARRTVCPPRSPSAQATPAPPRPAPPAYTRGGTVHPPLRAGHTNPTPRAPPCPRTQEDGRCVQPRPAYARKGRDGAHNPALLSAGDTSPAPRALPAFARGGTVRPPLRAGHANPTPCAPPCPRTQEDGRRVQPRPAHARMGRDGAHSPALLGAGHQPNPKRPARIRKRRDVQPPAARARKGEGRRIL
ncbi:hypothetical protein EDB83DRAFT_2531456 [Lactarius deliciosus]|nr:hypothetical protein EDB83DRAFT_2531456 [Lactarius deliciosus]